MTKAKKQLETIFTELNDRMDSVNRERREGGLLTIEKAEVKLLGQMSLLADENVSAVLSLAQTADLDAWMKMDAVMKKELNEILHKHGLLYDEDSHLIWIPRDAKFETMFSFKHVIVKSIDPESALVSKAVKAPQKNKQLIREAITSGKFSQLVDRIENSGGNLEFFAED